MKMTSKCLLLTSASITALWALNAAPAFATVTFNIGSDSLTSAGSGNTSVSGNIATTGSSGDTTGASMTGSSAGTFTWNFNGNVTGTGGAYGIEVGTEGGGVTNINVGSSVTIQGDSSASGVIFSNPGSETNNLTNTGTIIGGDNESGLAAYQNTNLTIDNHGTIEGGSNGNQAVIEFSTGVITTLNNYSNGTLTPSDGANAIELDNTSHSAVINTAGTVNGTIQLGSTTGSGDTINIYSGTISGGIIAVDSSGNYGTVNFDLKGDTFGTGGTSGNGTFSTDGDIGFYGTLLNAVNINSGTLTLNNDIRATTTTIASGATLSLNGNGLFISNNLVNNGTLNIGTYFIATNNVSGTGVLEFTAQSGTGGLHGFINGSGGTASLSSMTIDPVFTSGAVVNGEKLVVVTNAPTLTFGSDKTISSNGVTWTLSEATGSGNDYQGDSYNSGDLLITASLAPSLSMKTIQSETAEGVSASRADSLTLTTPQTTTEYAIGSLLRTIPQTANLDTQSGMAAGESNEQTHFWMRGIGGNASDSSISGVAGYSADTYGASFGADRNFRDDVRLGAVFTYANTRAYSTTNDNIDSYMGNLYAVYKPSWYVIGMLTYGVHTVDSSRIADTELAQASFDQQEYGLTAQAGYPVQVNRFTVIPLVQFSYDELHQDGYAENGAGMSDLTMNGVNSNSYRSTLGVDASTTYALKNNWNLKPLVTLGWTHEFNKDVIPDQAGLTSDGTSFVAPGIKMPQDMMDFGASTEVASTQNVTFSADYQGEVGNHYTSNMGMLKVRIAF